MKTSPTHSGEYDMPIESQVISHLWRDCVFKAHRAVPIPQDPVSTGSTDGCDSVIVNLASAMFKDRVMKLISASGGGWQ